MPSIGGGDIGLSAAPKLEVPTSDAGWGAGDAGGGGNPPGADGDDAAGEDGAAPPLRTGASADDDRDDCERYSSS